MATPNQNPPTPPPGQGSDQPAKPGLLALLVYSYVVGAHMTAAIWLIGEGAEMVLGRHPNTITVLQITIACAVVICAGCFADAVLTVVRASFVDLIRHLTRKMDD